MNSKDIDIKKHFKKNAFQSLYIIFNILWGILIVATIFFGVWILHKLAKLLGMESSYFIIILNQVSEMGFIIMYLIITGWTIIYTYKLFKE